MIKALTGKYQKQIAWLFFFLLYGQMLVSLHASNRMYRSGNAAFINPRYQKTLAINTGSGGMKVQSTEKDIFDRKISGNEALKNSLVAIAPKKDDHLDIGGPGQPEMSTFKSVGADNMVNLFTGDLSYNIPLLDVGGYPVNLFYSAGITMDQEASWVGLGWNINPGTISRNMRGLPDDYDGSDSIKKVQSINKDLTIGVTGSTGAEVTGIPGLSANISAGIFYNNRRGIGLEMGAKGEFSVQKLIAGKNRTEKTAKDTTAQLSLAFSAGINLNSQSGMSTSFGFDITKFNIEKTASVGLGTSIDYSSRQGLGDIKISGEYSIYKAKAGQAGNTDIQQSSYPYLSSSISFARSSFTPSIRMPLTRFNQFYSVKLGTEKMVLFKNGTIGGYINESRLAPADTVQQKPAYGYMNYEKANNDKNALMDFNRLNDGVYTYKTPVISIPVYTYDVFSISGEGTGGAFRGYRGNTGYVKDNYTKTRTSAFSLSLDVGPGQIFHGGTMLGGVYAPSMVEEWEAGNALRETSAFNNTDSIYQTFYFKNPAERPIIDESYYNQLGADQLIRPYLTNTRSASPLLASSFQAFDKDRNVERTLPITTSTYRKERDKRSQVITYLTAYDASFVGLDKSIYSYTENHFLPGTCDDEYKTKISRYQPGFYRKPNHISEIDVLESDGKRYVYGIPVYQVKQKEVTFSILPATAPQNQLVPYNPASDNSTRNTQGADHFYQREEVGGYAHSFLLTGILSPDYLDVTGDGITDDDLGTAIKFKYSRVDKQHSDLYNKNYWNTYKWRMPVGRNTANYNQGLKTDKNDDKGLYTYGEKELWYMHSIESKNMVATFYISSRDDGSPVIDENGGVPIIAVPGQKMLDHINLYTKADYLKHGSDARPVKTVHFKYSYKLCPGFTLNRHSDEGKLTLDSLWFTYNGNERQKKNKYVFNYGPTTANPGYNSAESDRWGNYKSHSGNPAGVGNNDYPYTSQDTATSNAYAAAWNLQKILLPGGAVMNIQYEADDYAFVQDKRACQATRMVGLGMTSASPPSQNLYTKDASQMQTPGAMDHRFVFFDVAQPMQDVPEISAKYLQGFTQLLLKLWVKMPFDKAGDGYEPVVVYGAIKGYGFARNANGTDNHYRFYVELEKTKNGGSPIMETVMQFMKDNLPAQAYPGYDVSGNSGLAQVVKAVRGMANSFADGVFGFERNLKSNNRCKEFNASLSFARLNNPLYKKVGGGHRVKQVIISDNWSKMTDKTDATGRITSYYGQQYDYTTTEVVNGKKVVISSGVAAYEPGVGNEENPFREVLKYSEGQPLGPTNHENVELPIAETFFPAPMVGYSKVTVRSIHSNTDDKKIKSGIGLQQTEFYTTRDFPVITDFSSFDGDSRHQHKPGAIEKIFNFDTKDYLTLTQGFRVVLNDMNGKMKSQTSFPENDLQNPINYTAWYYRVKPTGNNKYELDNLLPVIESASGKISNKLIGKDIEVMNDFREHFSYTYAKQIPINADFFTIGFFPVLIPTIFGMFFKDESMYRSATTLKVVNEFGILDSIVNIDKGSMVSTRNMVYDAETGEVLISKTNNEFNKPVFQFNYPAWWSNSGMEPAYRNIDLTYKDVLFRDGRIEESPQVNMARFESGDEIYVQDMANIGPAETAPCITTGNPATLPQSSENRIWAVDLRKDTANKVKEFIFLDRYGTPYNSARATIRVIRSGKRNLAGASVGNVVSLGNPIRTVDGQQRVIIDGSTDVINSGAAMFKERWRANDIFYTRDEQYTTTKKVPLHSVTVAAVQTNGSYSIGYYRPSHLIATRHDEAFLDPDYFMARQFDNGGGSHSDGEQKSWVLFDFGTVTSADKIVSAKLSLYSHKADLHTIIVDGYDNASHNASNPHLAFAGHANNFILDRMLSPWNGSTQWYTQYNTQLTGSQDEVHVTGTPGASAKDYSNSPGDDSRIDVTDMVRKMLIDKSDISKQYATALKIRIATYDEGHGEARVCFFSKDPIGGHGFTAPRIDLQYYNCDDTYTSGPFETCTTTATGKFCYSVFTKKQMNPYVEGVLGNWRPWRSYVYYGERKEGDPATTTDIRVNGIIKDFDPYWTFTDSTLAMTNSAKWVWNSEITQYNRKGAELENHDPLDRYNSGIYGYQESMPVAVVNNSRLRLSAFDGFEDYSYQDDPCEPFCKPSQRHFKTGIIESLLDTMESHTGKYSLKVNVASSYSMNVNVSPDDTVSSPDVRIKINKTAITTVLSVTPKGIGLRGSYFNVFTPALGQTTTCVRTPDYPDILVKAKNNDRDCQSGGDQIPGCTQCGSMTAVWEGYLQVQASGDYEFTCTWGDDNCDIVLNDTLICDGKHNSSTYNETLPYPIHLNAGALNTIKVSLHQGGNYGEIHVKWKKPGDIYFSRIPAENLYPAGQESLADGSTQTSTVYCIKPDTIQTIHHQLIDSFNLVPGKKMVMSVWVKKGTQDCKCTGYNNVNIVVKDAFGSVIQTLAPKEHVIEGWQQFEAVFTVPEAGNKISLEFNGPEDAALYVDDLRLHPFNANMKSFVYDPVNLRLSAELDENNYASFYEYDDEGTLVRVKKETREGIKTISETRSALQKTITDF